MLRLLPECFLLHHDDDFLNPAGPIYGCHPLAVLEDYLVCQAESLLHAE